MNIQAILSAVPWLRRLWRVLPGPLRIPLLLVAGAIGVWYAITGRRELTAQQRAAGGSAAATDDVPPSEPPSSPGGASSS